MHNESSVTVGVVAPLLHYSALESLPNNCSVPFLKQIQSLEECLRRSDLPTYILVTLSIHSWSVMDRKMSASVSQV